MHVHAEFDQILTFSQADRILYLDFEVMFTLKAIAHQNHSRIFQGPYGPTAWIVRQVQCVKNRHAAAAEPHAASGACLGCRGDHEQFQHFRKQDLSPAMASMLESMLKSMLEYMIEYWLALPNWARTFRI